MYNTALLVHKQQLGTTEIRTLELPALAEGQVRVTINRFALTSNNITYAAFGDAMNYWKFFPVASAHESAWGQIPVWGFGTVSASNHPDVPVGDHLYGYFPMAQSVDLTPVKVSAQSFYDGAPHRAELHPVYNQYTRTATDPFYNANTEDLQALLRPLFITSWLIDDFLADNDYFGAPARGKAVMLLSSASSKTAYGTAFQMAQRSGIEVVGLTSPGNVSFCEHLGCYHRVLVYDDITTLAPDTPSIYVDFAGNAGFRKRLHAHLDGLVFSSSIGGTHVSDLGGGKDLAGPKPTLFFAPAQVKKRSTEWGAQVLGQRLLSSWNDFLKAVQNPNYPWLTVEHHHGAAAVQAVYLQLLAGKTSPNSGHMLTL